MLLCIWQLRIYTTNTRVYLVIAWCCETSLSHFCETFYASIIWYSYIRTQEDDLMSNPIHQLVLPSCFKSWLLKVANCWRGGYHRYTEKDTATSIALTLLVLWYVFHSFLTLSISLLYKREIWTKQRRWNEHFTNSNLNFGE